MSFAAAHCRCGNSHSDSCERYSMRTVTPMAKPAVSPIAATVHTSLGTGCGKDGGSCLHQAVQFQCQARTLNRRKCQPRQVLRRLGAVKACSSETGSGE
jgi:hypothetical protein